MASGSLPSSLHIQDTFATNGGQSFAGVNLGTINYASSGNNSYVDELLNSLPTAKDAPFNAYQRQHDPTCLPATRVDLLQEIHNWANSGDSPGVFWLSGLAGTGKSTIAKTVAMKYHSKGRLAASFFFSRAGADVNHAGKFITSIAYQMAQAIPALKPRICEAISKNKDIASQSLDEQWHELIRSYQAWRRKTPDRKVQSLKGIQLRVLLTSRPESSIKYGFTQVRSEEHQDFLLHNIEPAIIEHDISTFLRHKLRLTGQRFRLKNGWPKEKAITRLVQNSGGLFIWAATASRFINEDSQLAETRLSSFIQEGNTLLPPESKLDEIYSTILANSIPTIHIEGEGQLLQQRFRQIVGPIILLQDNLSVASLAKLLRSDVETVQRTLTSLHSVLDVPVDGSDAVQLLHPSFRDFLLNPSRCSNSQFHINNRLVHGEMYNHCLRVMSTQLRRNICQLGWLARSG